MKRGTESIVRLGKSVEPADFSGINVLSTVILGKKESATKDFNGLFITDAVLLGKKISHAAVVTATVHGVSPLSLPSAVANSLAYVKAFGGAEIKPEEYIDSVTALGKTEQRNLPKGYVELEYIESTGTQEIDTGVLPSAVDDIYVRFKNTTTDAGYLIGAAGGNQYNYVGIHRAFSGYGENWGAGSQYTGFSVPADTSNIHVIKVDLTSAPKFYLDNALKATQGTYATITSTYTLRVNANVYGDSKRCSARYYDVKLSKNGSLVRDFVPAKNSSGVVGMYDTVSGEFFTNKGSGTFTAGPAVTIPEEYTPIDYVYMLPESYLLTDIVPTYDMRIEMDFQTTSTVSQAVSYLSSGTSLRFAHVTAKTFRVNAWGNTYDSTSLVTNDTRYKFVYDNLVATLKSGDTTVFTNTFTDIGTSTTLLTINGFGTTDVSQNVEGIYLYSFKVWNAQGNLIADYIPCRRQTTIGFYDSVSGRFLTATAGVWSSGPVSTKSLPNPDKPIDIWCNNGVLKLSPNLLNDTNISSGYNATGNYVFLGYYTTNSQIYQTSNSYRVAHCVLPAGTYRFETDTENTYILRVSINNVVRDVGLQAQYYEFTLTETSEFSICYRQNPTAPFSGEHSWIVRGTSATEYHEYNSVYADGAVETITDALGNTATAEILLNANIYTDEQEIISGQVTRNLDVKVFNGTENWTQLTNNRGFFYGYADNDICRVGVPLQSQQMFCTHFNFVIWSNNSVPMATNSIGYNIDSTTQSSNGNITIRPDTTVYNTVEKWKAFLAEQYANGTPVIVVRIANQATESVAGQVLKKEPLTVAGALEDLIVRATSTEHTVPTPDYPLEINSNNGVLKASVNEFDASAVTNGYYYNDDLEWVANSSTYTTDYMKTVKGKYTLTVNRVASQTATVNIRVNLFNANKVIQSQVVIPITPDATEFIYEVDIPDGISYVRISTNPTVVVVSSFSNSNSVYADGTVETIKDSLNNTATTEMLLKVGDYQDVQSIIDGVVTRNIRVKVLDGTENWTASSTYPGSCYAARFLDTAAEQFPVFYCSHFAVVRDVSNYARGKCLITGSESQGGWRELDIWYGDNRTTAVADLKQWLADQYAAGTPVIIIYPLATPTTESVAGQALQVQDGDNTLEITQASMDGLELEAQYQKRT